MKKVEYLAPEMEVIELQLNKFLCESDGEGEGDTAPGTGSSEGI